MSQPPSPASRPPIIDEVGTELYRLFKAAEARQSQRRHRRRRARWRSRPFALIAVLLLGGATAAIAATGVFTTGTPVGPNVPANPVVANGVAIASSVRLLPLAVNDPAGAPPWGLRETRTTRGLVCLQYGRLVDGRLGVLGQDGAFANDGRFHPLSSDYFDVQACAELDTHNHGFINAVATSIPASAYESSCVPPRPNPNGHHRQHLTPGKACPASSLRNIYYGLLGPDAISITYVTSGGRRVTEPTVGPDGAYLVVGSPTSELCFGGRIGAHSYRGCGNGDSSSPDLRAYTPTRSANLGVIRAVHYRNGKTCRVTLLSACPPVGYSAPPEQYVTASEIRAPITIHTSLGWHACTSPKQDEPCRTAPPGYRLSPYYHGAPGGPPRLRAVISFRSRVAIATDASAYRYQLQLTPTAAAKREHLCKSWELSGSFGVTYWNIRNSQQVVERFFNDQRCPGTVHGSIEFVTTNGPTGEDVGIPGQNGETHGTPVAHFSYDVP